MMVYSHWVQAEVTLEQEVQKNQSELQDYPRFPIEVGLLLVQNHIGNLNLHMVEEPSMLQPVTRPLTERLPPQEVKG